MAPGIAAVSLPEGLIEWWQAARGRLGSRPLCALLEGPITLEASPHGPDTVHLLIERSSQGDLQLGGATAALAGLLTEADSPVPFDHLIRRAIKLGADQDEAEGLIQGLLDEGLLVEGLQPLSS